MIGQRAAGPPNPHRRGLSLMPGGSGGAGRARGHPRRRRRQSQTSHFSGARTSSVSASSVESDGTDEPEPSSAERLEFRWTSASSAGAVSRMEQKYVVRFARNDPETPPTMDEQIALARKVEPMTANGRRDGGCSDREG